MKRIAVIDFETTGMSPSHGARATEVAVVLLSNGQIVDRYQSLMNAGTYVPGEITRLTGITNEMVSSAPPAGQVIQELREFVQDAIMVAHNAPFDRRFLISEGQMAGVNFNEHCFLCTLLLSRRVYPTATNHRLSTLAGHIGLKVDGDFHRALFDAEITGQLFLRMIEKIKAHGIEQVSFNYMNRLQRSKVGCVI